MGAHPAEQQGDLLDVLRRGGEQSLLLHTSQTAVARVAVSVQLFGVGEAALHGLFPALIDTLAHAAEPMLVHLLPARLPDMPCHHLGCVARLRALVPHRAVAALARIGVILPIAFAVGGAVGKQLPVRTDIDIQLFLVAVLTLVKVAFAVGGRPIADYPVNIALLEPLRNRRCRIAGIHTHRPD